MKFYFWTILLVVFLFSCSETDNQYHSRPRDVWAFRSVLDKKPRMLTLALDSNFYAAYDLANCKLYKIWNGGVSLDGAPYTGKKDIQPTSWGESYLLDSTKANNWITEIGETPVFNKVISSGYHFKNNQIFLHFKLITEKNDTIEIEERPEIIKSDVHSLEFERRFSTKRVPDNLTIYYNTRTSKIKIKSNATTVYTTQYKKYPIKKNMSSESDTVPSGVKYMQQSDCFTCHKLDKDEVGPSFKSIANHYPNSETVKDELIKKIRTGGSGTWGKSVMNPHLDLAIDDVSDIVNYIFTLRTTTKQTKVVVKQRFTPSFNASPGSGAALEGVHPSYDLSDLHTHAFSPRVGGLAFLPDGKLLLTTWDTVGGVYLITNATSSDSSSRKIKRIASGLAEPLGIEVVDEKIFVLQKQELTQLIDYDGDEIIDEYRTICNGWDVTADFHEFAFGLLYRDGYFYVTLSMAMRLHGEKQLPDRGTALKIGLDGNYEQITNGLRTPNGIGVGVDDEIFIVDNQGQWLPANKLIHLKKGTYNGMQWGWLNDTTPPPPMAPPAIWMPEDEIANSPSEPVLIHEGAYKGQLLHGDVTHGGIKRDFLEKVNGDYQGAIFRFTQGLQAGVNRLRWGPDGALYIGEVGMKGGGWSWKDNLSGLQRLTYNGKPTFEMLAIRAKSNGFEIEFTQSLAKNIALKNPDIVVEQWWYLPTNKYGGPKMDVERLSIKNISLSDDRKKLTLEIPNLKREHVIYFRLPLTWEDQIGNRLWSSESWYTLNNIPQ